MRISGIQAMLEMLAGCGVRYLFGNPGTTELPLIDAMVGRAAPQYILALQEIPAMAIADGYAQASGTPGVVNVHICCGLGNAMGMLYNAYREGTPLVVTAGQQDRRLMFEEPILWGDMVAVARPWTKWAAEVDADHRPAFGGAPRGADGDDAAHRPGLPLAAAGRADRGGRAGPDAAAAARLPRPPAGRSRPPGRRRAGRGRATRASWWAAACARPARSSDWSRWPSGSARR